MAETVRIGGNDPTQNVQATAEKFISQAESEIAQANATQAQAEANAERAKLASEELQRHRDNENERANQFRLAVIAAANEKLAAERSAKLNQALLLLGGSIAVTCGICWLCDSRETQHGHDRKFDEPARVRRRICRSAVSSTGSGPGYELRRLPRGHPNIAAPGID